ncbi:hypothetical protein ACWCQK_36585 [Streptomyces sp. NPDC002306]
MTVKVALGTRSRLKGVVTRHRAVRRELARDAAWDGGVRGGLICRSRSWVEALAYKLGSALLPSHQLESS